VGCRCADDYKSWSVEIGGHHRDMAGRLILLGIVSDERAAFIADGSITTGTRDIGAGRELVSAVS